MFDTIEALYQEMEQYIELNEEHKRARIRQAQEIERHRKALQKASEVLTTWLCARTPEGKQAKKEALAEIDKALGGGR